MSSEPIVSGQGVRDSGVVRDPKDGEKEAMISRTVNGQDIVKDKGVKHVEFDTQLHDKRLEKLRGRHRSGSKKSEDGSTEYSETGRKKSC